MIDRFKEHFFNAIAQADFQRVVGIAESAGVEKEGLVSEDRLVVGGQVHNRGGQGREAVVDIVVSTIAAVAGHVAEVPNIAGHIVARSGDFALIGRLERIDALPVARRGGRDDLPALIESKTVDITVAQREGQRFASLNRNRNGDLFVAPGADIGREIARDDRAEKAAVGSREDGERIDAAIEKDLRSGDRIAVGVANDRAADRGNGLQGQVDGRHLTVDQGGRYDLILVGGLAEPDVEGAGGYLAGLIAAVQPGYALIQIAAQDLDLDIRQVRAAESIGYLAFQVAGPHIVGIQYIQAVSDIGDQHYARG